MNRTKSFLTAIFLASVSSLALAQHGGHASGGGFGHAGHDPSMEDLQKKMRIQATDEQRAQLRTCLDLSERFRVLAEGMMKPTNLPEPEWRKVREQWGEGLRQAMQSDHEAFVKSLNADQQAALKGRLRKMDKVWSDVASHFETMDHGLAETAPDAKRLADHAKQLEKSLKKWQKQHRELGSEIGIES